MKFRVHEFRVHELWLKVTPQSPGLRALNPEPEWRTRMRIAGLQTDLRFGLRLLRRNPETSVIAILAMAVAIGIAGTMFSVVNAILIQPLPFKQPIDS